MSNQISLFTQPSSIDTIGFTQDVARFKGMTINLFGRLVTEVTFEDALALKRACKAFYWAITHHQPFLDMVMRAGSWQILSLANPESKMDPGFQELARRANNLGPDKPLSEIEFFKADKDVVTYGDVPSELLAREEVVMAAVQQDSVALQYASENYRNDKEVMMAAVQQYSGALQYAYESYRNEVSHSAAKHVKS